MTSDKTSLRDAINAMSGNSLKLLQLLTQCAMCHSRNCMTCGIGYEIRMLREIQEAQEVKEEK